METAPAIGIDVGGTKIAGALVAADGRLLAETRHESPATDVAAILGTIVNLVDELRQHTGEAPAGVGVAAAGFVAEDRSTIYFAPNLAWRSEKIGVELNERLGCNVVVENDANAAAWGEYRFGGHDDSGGELLALTIGTGIGGGLVHGGELVRGGFGIAGEVGHLRVEQNGRLCGCGQHGCWEQYGSGSALTRTTRKLVAARTDGSEHLLQRAGGDADAVTGPMIGEAAAAGDAFAKARLEELGTWIGIGAASLAAVLDPRLIVLGGGVSEIGEPLLEVVRRAFEANLPAAGFRPVAEIRIASLGNRAGVLGAADLSRPRAHD